MKIGIISDIHSNIYAFKACTEYMEKQKCDEYFFLGDYISDTPYKRNHGLSVNLWKTIPVIC